MLLPTGFVNVTSMLHVGYNAPTGVNRCYITNPLHLIYTHVLDNSTGVLLLSFKYMLSVFSLNRFRPSSTAESNSHPIHKENLPGTNIKDRQTKRKTPGDRNVAMMLTYKTFI